MISAATGFDLLRRVRFEGARCEDFLDFVRLFAIGGPAREKIWELLPQAFTPTAFPQTEIGAKCWWAHKDSNLGPAD
jgi:hypothetical protein